ncbi:DJ-1/PfpI family protein [Evansella cellulosilytica]|uniref:ThiJ/PfpI domain-containing protein n=1 Tax=Evansella cellulosilytica (strain ATCC 21833 / DSM 2522 / FERM P-1141 / JCM 9156 / N-4) TaxID=649639 RepID=E6TVD6_EVAC2|nr:DJ-1/PfpI family protein [Evansella cellulosilytica]ADU30953.1 ThiJ/PfpI domain-containing protein [Evansella cellulosilytica DSM 2522]
MTEWTVGILLFNEVEILDFAGPYEVFSITTMLDSNEQPFKVVTISETSNMITARNGLKVLPDYSYRNHPPLDIVIVPGGYGAEEIEIKNQNLLEWINQQSKTASYMCSVCTGAFLLAEAGLLNGRKATTHWMDIERLKRDYTEVNVQTGVKFIDEGEIITSGGISAGITMSFHIISKLLGIQVATYTAKRMEYDVKL